MKKLICLSLVLLLSFALMCPALAAEDTFVPSISYKDSPEIVVGEDGVIGVVHDEDGQVIDYIYEPCLLITPVAEAETSTSIPEDARQMLLYVYNELSNGTMKLPAEKLDASLEPDEVVIRELFDATWLCSDHPVMVAPKGITFDVTFRVNVDADETVYVMTYKNDEWNPIVNVVNNGDGTITCTFEDLCPVAFIVGEDGDTPGTGSITGEDLTLWFILLVASSAALAAVMIYRRKTAQQ